MAPNPDAFSGTVTGRGQANLQQRVVWPLCFTAGLPIRSDQLFQSLPGFPLPDPTKSRQLAKLLGARVGRLLLPVVDRLGADSQKLSEVVRRKSQSIAL